jgi:hypothetical protein
VGTNLIVLEVVLGDSVDIAGKKFPDLIFLAVDLVLNAAVDFLVVFGFGFVLLFEEFADVEDDLGHFFVGCGCGGRHRLVIR